MISKTTAWAGIFSLILAYFVLFTVDEREKVIMFSLGKIERTEFTPGIYWKVPFINNIRKYDARIQTLDADPERYLTSEKKNVLVDSFVKWKIKDIGKFFTAAGGDMRRANVRLSQIVKDGLRGEFGKRTIQEVISGERNDISNIILTSANEQMSDFGMEVVDVRLKRIDLPLEVSNSVYQRMEAERTRVAKELRSQGSEAAEKIKAEADRKRTIILADAYRDSEELRGNGDAKAAETYAKAYNKDSEFYAFYRSLDAYRQTFSGGGDMLLLEPNTEYFNYFGSKATNKK